MLRIIGIVWGESLHKGSVMPKLYHDAMVRLVTINLYHPPNWFIHQKIKNLLLTNVSIHVIGATGLTPIYRRDFQWYVVVSYNIFFGWTIRLGCLCNIEAKC